MIAAFPEKMIFSGITKKSGIAGTGDWVDDMMHLADIVNTYDALFLDNDGTCARTEELHAVVGAQILQEAGVNITYEERFSLTGYGEFGIWEHLDKQGRTPSISKEQFKQLQSERFLAALTHISDPAQLARPGIVDLARAFRDAGKPVLVVSNTAADIVMAVQKASGLTGLVDTIITFDDIQARGLQKKPAPDPYTLARQLSGKPINGKFLAVEDSKIGMDSALGDGCDVLQIYYESLNQQPDPRATYAVGDSLNLCAAFAAAASGGSTAPQPPLLSAFKLPVPAIK
jgi:beta-phosphoglucomutase-like phosphatase (HAD superfamily)